jgi:DNA-directed RNA polymerase I subunit RPA34
VPTALSGKREAWLIQVPPGFDITKLKSLPLPQNEFDRRSLTVADASYAISNNSDNFKLQNANSSSKASTANGGKRVRLLAAGGDEGNLKISSKTFSQYLQITPEVVIPTIDYNKVTVPKPTVPAIEGLEVRHYSTGYGPHKTAVVAATSSKKRASTDNEAAEPSPKKSKKEKKDKKEKKEKKEKKDKKKDKKSKA